MDQVAAELILRLWLVAGGVGCGRRIQQCVHSLAREPPTDVENNACDHQGGDGVRIFQPGQGVAFAGKAGCKAEHHGQRSPHIRREVDRVGQQCVRAVLASNATERARAGKVHNNGDHQHRERPQRGPEVVMVVEGWDDAADGLGYDPDAGGEHDAGFHECRERLDLAVSVVVVFVRGSVGDLDGEQGDGGGDQVDGGVSRLAEHAERAGENSSQQLEQRNDAGGEDGKCRRGALSSMGLAGSLLVDGRWAHGRDATGSATQAHWQ